MKKTLSFIIAVGFLVPSLVPLAHADTASVQAQLQALMQELSQLQNQANITTSSPVTAPTASASPNPIFTSNLTIGSQGTEVFRLQQALINDGYLTAISIPTGYFGPATKNALAAYQRANGIVPASGFFGPLTRATLNNIDGEVTALTATTGAQALANVQYQYDQLQSSSTSASTTVSQPVTTVVPQPTASIEANGSTGSVMIPYDNPATLTWSSSNADSCNISPAELSGTSGDQTTADLTTSQIYSITCMRGDESTTASVTVNVSAPPPPWASVTPSENNPPSVSSVYATSSPWWWSESMVAYSGLQSAIPTTYTVATAPNGTAYLYANHQYWIPVSDLQNLLTQCSNDNLYGVVGDSGSITMLGQIGMTGTTVPSNEGDAVLSALNWAQASSTFSLTASLDSKTNYISFSQTPSLQTAVQTYVTTQVANAVQASGNAMNFSYFNNKYSASGITYPVVCGRIQGMSVAPTLWQ